MAEDKLPAGVLIVDDNPGKLIALGAALAGLDVEIVTANSGMGALHALLAQDFAVVLLDVNMPVMDGFETATMIRSRSSSEHLPIIFITSEALTDDFRLKGYELGAVDYILSPVLPQILRAKVSTFADLHRLREQSYRYGDEMLKKNEEIARQNNELTSIQAQLNQLNDGLEAKVIARTVALQESEALLKESQAIARMGSYVLDIPAGVWKSSDMLDQLFGIDETYERSMEGWGVLIHPDDRAMMTCNFKNEVLKSGKDFDQEYRILRRGNQAEFWVHEIGKMELDAQGRPLKMHGTIQDITERKRLLEELRMSLQREQEMRELAYMEQLSRTSQGSLTEQAFGVLRLRQSAPEFFDALVQRFAQLLDMALEQRVLRVAHPIANELRMMAEHVGVVKAGPRDVIDIYVYALKQVSCNAPPQKAQAYAEESRLLVLELMGNMVSFYRKYFSNGTRNQAAKTGQDSNESNESNESKK